MAVLADEDSFEQLADSRAADGGLHRLCQMLHAVSVDAGNFSQLRGECFQSLTRAVRQPVVATEQFGVGVGHDDELIATEQPFAFLPSGQSRVVGSVERFDRLVEGETRSRDGGEGGQHDGQHQPEAASCEQQVGQPSQPEGRRCGHEVFERELIAGRTLYTNPQRERGRERVPATLDSSRLKRPSLLTLRVGVPDSGATPWCHWIGARLVPVASTSLQPAGRSNGNLLGFHTRRAIGAGSL